MRRDRLPVEVLAGEGDNAAVAKVVETGQDPAVPAGEDRLAARLDDGVIVLGALDIPCQRAAEGADEKDVGDSDSSGFDPLKRCERGVGHAAIASESGIPGHRRDPYVSLFRTLTDRQRTPVQARLAPLIIGPATENTRLTTLETISTTSNSVPAGLPSRTCLPPAATGYR